MTNVDTYELTMVKKKNGVINKDYFLTYITSEKKRRISSTDSTWESFYD